MKRKLITSLSIPAALVVIPAALITWAGLSDKIGKADVALVLGNKVYPDGSPSPQLKGRLDKAIEMYSGGHFPVIIVSGGTGKEGVPEGTAMKKYLVEAGVPDSAIIVDDHGMDTYSSAINTRRIMEEHGMESVFVITQFFHIPRSRMALEKCGIRADQHAYSDYITARDLYSTLREVPAYVKYSLISYE